MNKKNYKPNINKRSTYLAQFNTNRKKEPNTFKRLAKEDPVVTSKLQVLTEMYTPSFKPVLHKNNTMHEGTTKKEEEKVEGKEIYEIDINDVPQKDIDEVLRNTLFSTLVNKKKKKKKEKVKEKEERRKY